MSPTSPFPMQQVGNANPMMAAMQAQSLSSRNLNMNGGGMSPTSPFPMQQQVGNPYAMNPMAAAFQMQGGNPYAMNNQMGAFQGQQSTSAKSNPMLSSSSKKMTSAPVNATTSPLFLNNNITINEESSPGTSPTVAANEGVASPPDATNSTAPSPSPSSTTN